MHGLATVINLHIRAGGPLSDHSLRLINASAAALEILDQQIEAISGNVQNSERSAPSKVLSWIEVYSAANEIIKDGLEEDQLKSLFILAEDKAGSIEPTEFAAQFVKDLRGAWEEFGRIDYHRYGIRDRMTQLRIALYGLDRAKFDWIIPLHMKSKINNILHVGERVDRMGSI